MNPGRILRKILTIRTRICNRLRPKSIDLYARQDGRIDNDLIYFIIAFHLDGLVIDMLCMQGIEVDKCDRKTYQKL